MPLGTPAMGTQSSNPRQRGARAGSVASSGSAGESAFSRSLGSGNWASVERTLFLVFYSLSSTNALRDIISTLGLLVEPLQLMAVSFDSPHFTFGPSSLLVSWISFICTLSATTFQSVSYEDAKIEFYVCVALILTSLALFGYVAARLKLSNTSPRRALVAMRFINTLLLNYFFMPILEQLLKFGIPLRKPNGVLVFAAFENVPIEYGHMVGAWILFAFFGILSFGVAAIAVDTEGFFGMSHGRAELFFLTIKLLLSVTQRLVPHLGTAVAWVRPLLALSLLWGILHWMPFHSIGANMLRGGFFSLYLVTSIIELFRSSFGLSEANAADLLALSLPLAMYVGMGQVKRRWTQVVRRMPNLETFVRMIAQEEEPRVADQLRRRLHLRSVTDVEISVRHVMAGCSLSRATGYVKGGDAEDGGNVSDSWGWLVAMMGFAANSEEQEQSAADRAFDNHIDGGETSAIAGGMNIRGRKIAASQFLYHRAALEMGEATSLFFLSYLNWVHVNDEAVQVSITAAEAQKISTIDLRFSFFRYLFERRRAAVGEGVGTVRYLDLSKSRQTAARYQKVALRELQSLWLLLGPGGANLERLRLQISKIGHAESHAARAHLSLVKHHSYSASVLREYGIFLAQVRNDQEAADTFLVMADAVEEEAAASRAASLAHRLHRQGASTSAPSSQRTAGELSALGPSRVSAATDSQPFLDKDDVDKSRSEKATKGDEDVDAPMTVRTSTDGSRDVSFQSDEVVASDEEEGEEEGGGGAAFATAQVVAGLLGKSDDGIGASAPPTPSPTSTSPSPPGMVTSAASESTPPPTVGSLVTVDPGTTRTSSTPSKRTRQRVQRILGAGVSKIDDDEAALAVEEFEGVVEVGESDEEEEVVRRRGNSVSGKEARKKIASFRFDKKSPGKMKPMESLPDEENPFLSNESDRILDTEATNPREFMGIRQFRMVLFGVSIILLIVLVVPFVVNFIMMDALVKGTRLSAAGWRREYVLLQLATRIADEERYTTCGTEFPDADPIVAPYNDDALIPYDEMLGELVYYNFRVVFCGIGVTTRLDTYSRFIDPGQLSCEEAELAVSPTNSITGTDSDVKSITSEKTDKVIWMVEDTVRPVDDLAQRFINRAKNLRTIRDPAEVGVPFAFTQSFWRGLAALIRLTGGSRRRILADTGDRRQLKVHQPDLLYIPGMPPCVANYTATAFQLTNSQTDSQQKILYNAIQYANALRDGGRYIDKSVEDTNTGILLALIAIAIDVLVCFVAFPIILLRGLRTAFFEAHVGLYLIDAIPLDSVRVAKLRAEGNSDNITEAQDMKRSASFDELDENKGPKKMKKAVPRFLAISNIITSKEAEKEKEEKGKGGRRGLMRAPSSAERRRDLAMKYAKGPVPASLCLEVNRIRSGSVLEDAVLQVRKKIARARGVQRGGSVRRDSDTTTVAGFLEETNAISRAHVCAWMDNSSLDECYGRRQKEQLDPTSSEFDHVTALIQVLEKRSVLEPRFEEARRRLLWSNGVLFIVVLALIITLPVLFSESRELHHQLEVITEYLSAISRTSWEYSKMNSKSGTKGKPVWTFANLPWNVSLAVLENGESMSPWWDWPREVNSRVVVNKRISEVELLHRCILYGCEEYQVKGVSTSEKISEFFFADSVGVDSAIQTWIDGLRTGTAVEPIYNKVSWELLARLPLLYLEEVERWSTQYLFVLSAGVAFVAVAGMTVSFFTYRRYVLEFQDDVRNARFILSLFSDAVIDHIPFMRSYLLVTAWAATKNLEDVSAIAEEDEFVGL